MQLSQEDRTAYIEHRSHLVKSGRLGYEQFDKAVFLLAGGGLTISLTLIEKIIPFTLAQYTIFIIGSWLLFTSSIISTLVSFRTSIKALELECEKIDHVLSTEDTAILESDNPYSTKTAVLNTISLYCLIGAILALVLFVGINVSGHSSKNEIEKPTTKIEVKKMVNPKNVEKRGYVPPPPPKPTPVLPDNTNKIGGGYIPPSAPTPTPKPPKK